MAARKPIAGRVTEKTGCGPDFNTSPCNIPRASLLVLADGGGMSEMRMTMTWKAISASAIAAIALFMAAPGPVQAQDATQATNNCAAGEKIDGSTANDARAKLEAAGYTDVTG